MNIPTSSILPRLSSLVYTRYPDTISLLDSQQQHRMLGFLPALNKHSSMLNTSSKPVPAPDQIQTFIQNLFSLPSSHPVTVNRLTTGITNILYKCSWQPVPPHPAVGCCLIRVHGKNTESFINRADELKIIRSLHSTYNMFPPVYAVYSWGIVYGFVEGRALVLDDLKDAKMNTEIARFLAGWHQQIQIDGICNNTDGGTAEASLVPSLQNLYSSIPVTFSVPEKQHLFCTLVQPLLPTTQQFNQVLRDLVEKVREMNISVSFCHNDLLPGNIIWNGNEIRLIDFEYASYNYASYDIANHFCEYAGFDCDWQSLPTVEEQRTWIKEYLKYRKVAAIDTNLTVNPSGNVNVTEDAVDCLLKEVQMFIPYCHLFWGLWAIKQGEISDVDFDYLQYAAKRLSQIKSLF